MIRLLLCLILVALPVRAEMPAGHDDPRFTAAVEAWLDADDRAYTSLFELSDEGNLAAQIFLGRVGQTHALWPEDPSWDPDVLLQRAAERSRIARAFLRATAKNGPDFDAARELLRLGEPHAVLEMVRRWDLMDWDADILSAALTGTGDIMHDSAAYMMMGENFPSRAEHDAFLEDHCAGLFVRHPSSPFATVCRALGTDRLRSLLEALMPLSSGNVHDEWIVERISSWLASFDSPYRRACSTACPEQVAQCSHALFDSTLGVLGYYIKWSPWEGLVSGSRYKKSRRAMVDVIYSASPGFGTRNRNALKIWFGGGTVGECLANAYHNDNYGPWRANAE